MCMLVDHLEFMLDISRVVMLFLTATNSLLVPARDRSYIPCFPRDSCIAIAILFGPKTFGLIIRSPINHTVSVSNPLKIIPSLSNDQGKTQDTPALTVPPHPLTHIPSGWVTPTTININ